MAANDKSGFWNDWKTKHPRWHRLLVLELACTAGLFVVGLIWLGGADIWLFWSENRDNVRDLGVTLAAVIGLPLLIWRERTGHRTANIAAERHEKQTEADRERRITDSFTKAVELLSKPELEVRLGAIYALERIARESQRDHWPIMETLTAFVRAKAPAQAEVQNASRSNQGHSLDKAVESIVGSAQRMMQDQPTQLGADIQAVLTVLTRRIVEHEEKNQRINLIGVNLFRADLRDVNLVGANLFRNNLIEANLFRADLRDTYLRDAKLIKANLIEASLIGAHLLGANLSGADLVGADLSRAYLIGADLSDADLSGADFSGADLSNAKLKNAKFCQTTMPDGTLNNWDCPPEPAPPIPSETPPVPN
jgi:uncharacterized protein YjbI with pentapeptide repeats